jgi:capsular polysaccharide biosynthesis protein
MELKEYWGIIKKDRWTLIAIAALAVLVSAAYFALRPVSYDVSLALNVTRSGTQQTDQYRYDDFYRLQADEKFVETVVEWLKNPRIAVDIYSRSGMDASRFSLRQLSKIFNSEKLSSQIVLVSFSARDENSARKISNSVSEIITKNVDALNENQKEGTWFCVIAQEPVIVKSQGNAWTILVFPLLAGIFIGLWAVMIRHYLK